MHLCTLWEPVDHLQGSLGPSGPETPKKSEKSLPESLEKVSKKSGESGKSLEKVPKDFFETFSRLSGGPGAGGPGRLFSDFFGVSGLEGPRDPCKWSTGSQCTLAHFQGFGRSCRFLCWLFLLRENAKKAYICTQSWLLLPMIMQSNGKLAQVHAGMCKSTL